MFLYRYLTVLGEEAARMMAAREQRACGRRLSLAGFGVLAGQLPLRTFIDDFRARYPDHTSLLSCLSAPPIGTAMPCAPTPVAMASSNTQAMRQNGISSRVMSVVSRC